MAGFTIVSTQVIIARNAGALYGVEVGNSNMASYVTQAGSNTDAFLNTVYTNSVGNTSTAAVADVLIANLGITDAAAAAYAKTYIIGQLNAVAYTARGAVVNTILSNFSNLTSDPTYGAYATAWNNQVNNAVTYATVSGNPDSTISLVPKTPAGQNFTLTTGIDTFTGGDGNDTFNATDSFASGTAAQTVTALDNLNGGAGSDTLNITTTKALSMPNMTVQNIETVNITSSTTVDGSVAGWTGLTTANVTETGGSGTAFTAASTTNVNFTDTAAAATGISVQGGNNVTVTANGVSGAGTVKVGDTTAVTGTVNVTENVLASSGTATLSAITVKGGSTVTVTENLAATATGANTITGGAVGITGSSATTTVTVNQTAAATAAAAVVAATGTLAVSAVTGAPGANGVTAVTAVAPATAKAAVTGVINGAVTIADANSGTTNANTITTVTLNNYGNSSIDSAALANLTLVNSGTGIGTVDLNNTAGWGTNTSLNLTVNGLKGTDTVTDKKNAITTLNVTTTGADSTLAAFADTALTTLNVAGSNKLTLSTVNTSLKTIAVSGSASFSGDISSTAVTTGFTTTSSGAITATLAAGTQSFTGSTGRDIITIAADAKMAIKGGSATNDVLVLNGNATTFNATSSKLTTTNVSGFEVLGTSTASQGTFDMSTLPTALTSIDMMGTAAAATSFTNVTAGTALAIDAAQTATVTYQAADANGSADSLSVSVNTGSTATTITVSELDVQDANKNGFGTLSVTSNGASFNGTSANNNVITKLVDSGLTTLNVSGSNGLTITTLDESVSNATSATPATSFTINNTSAGVGGVVITTLTDANLGSLTFTGTGNDVITTLSNTTGSTLNITNSGTGIAAIGTLTDSDNSLTKLTLSGSVALDANSTTATSNVIGSTTGLTVAGSTDNAHVNINVKGAAAGATDSITLGNGNNNITDGSTAGTVNVTVGTGANLIDVHTGGNNSTYAASITLGAHTNTSALYDKMLVSVTGSQAAGFSTAITGAATGDVIVFADAVDVAFTALSAAQQSVITSDATLSAAIGHAFGNLATGTAHAATAFTYQGNTYVVENVNAGTTENTFTAGTDSVVKLVGTFTVADFGTVAGAVAIA